MAFWRLVDPSDFSQSALPAHHDHWLCAAAFLIAIITASVFYPLARRFHQSSGSERYVWLLSGSFAAGIGVWAMHFTGMLAFRTVVAVSYDPLITAMSVVPAIVATAGCILLLRKDQRTLKGLALPALILAAGIGSMHYLGMEAMQVSADMYYVPSLFFFSLIAAAIFAYGGLLAKFYLGRDTTSASMVASIGGSVLMGCAIAAMHFTAMAATYFQPNADTVLTGVHSSSPWMVVAVSVAALIVLSSFFLAMVVDGRFVALGRNLQHSEVRFQRLADTTRTAIFTFNEQFITYANPALSQITGYSPKQLLRIPVGTLLGDEFLFYARQILDENAPKKQQTYYPQLEVVSASGEKHWLYLSMTRGETGESICGLASALDITDQKEAELQLQDLAYGDALTRLPNRFRFMEYLKSKLGRPGHYHVAIFDLDNFRLINDCYGHDRADQILVYIGNKLNEQARDGDMIARLSGDEFAVIRPVESEEAPLDEFADVLCDVLKESLRPYRVVLEVGASIGLMALCAESYERADDVVRDLGLARVRAKAAEGVTWAVYDSKLDEAAKRGRELEGELKLAVANGGLELYYQPIVDANDLSAKGFEALARWRRANGEMVSPAEFIPIAEKSGIIASIGLWALESAALQISEWNRRGFDPTLYISVNMAPVSVSDLRFQRKLAEVIENYGIHRGQLKLELTERVLMRDTELVQKRLQAFRDLGCDLMLDDFGTGYSSLSYLQKLPINVIKIDRSFVSALSNRGASGVIIKSIIAISQHLGMTTVSEGVETAPQAAILAELGSQYLQGYLFAQPMPANQATTWLAGHYENDARVGA